VLLPHDVLRHLPAVDDRDLHDAVERRIDACGLDALRLWPDCPQHTNQCLQYWLGVKLARCSPRRRPHHERQDADPRPRPQWGAIDGAHYRSVDGGPRLMRSILFYRSEYGQAEHPHSEARGGLHAADRVFLPPGGVVLDPFAGSGTTGLAIDEHFRARRRRLASLTGQWTDIYKKPLFTNDATARTTRRKQRPRLRLLNRFHRSPNGFDFRRRKILVFGVLRVFVRAGNLPVRFVLFEICYASFCFAFCNRFINISRLGDKVVTLIVIEGLVPTTRRCNVACGRSPMQSRVGMEPHLKSNRYARKPILRLGPTM
jgi:hypothetical protein